MNNRGLRLEIVIILVIAIVFMSVGFLCYTKALKIDKDSVSSLDSWSVHFDKNTFREVVGSVNPTSVSADESTISTNLTLQNIGDKYEFDIDVVNDGNMDAKLTSINLGGVSSKQSNFIDYIVTYDGVDYNSTVTHMNRLITANGTKKVHVKVLYKGDIYAGPITVNPVVNLNYLPV